VGRGARSREAEECRWLRPVLIGRFDFLEWTPDGQFRPSQFVGPRDDRRGACYRAEGLISPLLRKFWLPVGSLHQPPQTAVELRRCIVDVNHTTVCRFGCRGKFRMSSRCLRSEPPRSDALLSRRFISVVRGRRLPGVPVAHVVIVLTSGKADG
jgi:hypothetical protein